MKLSNRRDFLAGAAAVCSLAVGVPVASAQTTPAQTPAAPGQLSEDQLGQLLTAMGLKPDKKEQRYDFAFKAKMGEEEWELSMSTVLSRDGKSIWLMAWLDELPKSANDVPRTALLRLLAENDRLGNGKFFTYIPTNRRFVLQCTVPNENMTTAKFKHVLQDLGTSVVESHGVWAVKNWSSTPAANTAAAEAPAQSGTQQPAAQPATRSAVNDSKFEQPVRR
jgi:hypothetical protein